MSEEEDALTVGAWGIVIVMVAFPCAMNYTFGAAGLAWAFVVIGLFLWYLAQKKYRRCKQKEQTK